MLKYVKNTKNTLIIVQILLDDYAIWFITIKTIIKQVAHIHQKITKEMIPKHLDFMNGQKYEKFFGDNFISFSKAVFQFEIIFSAFVPIFVDAVQNCQEFSRLSRLILDMVYICFLRNLMHSLTYRLA